MASNQPRAFRLPPSDAAPAQTAEPRRAPRGVSIAPDTSLEALLTGEATPAVAPQVTRPHRRLFGFGRLLVSALGGLALIAIGTGIEHYVTTLIDQNAWLGGVALALAAIAGLALLALFVRELAAILRQRRINALRERALRLSESRDVAGMASLVADLAKLYAHRPDTARGRARLAELHGDVLDPRDRLAVAERELVAPLDGQARALVAGAAQRVSIVTTLAPRAVFDVLFVAGQSLWVIRRVSEIYGSRPGLISFLGLARNVLSHLAITGGMAVGDSLVQQVLGHGIASKLSAKLGEGVLNGLLTARVGLAAIESCRPLPFAAVAAPKLMDVAGALLRKSPGAPGEAAAIEPH